MKNSTIATIAAGLFGTATVIGTGIAVKKTLDTVEKKQTEILKSQETKLARAKELAAKYENPEDALTTEDLEEIVELWGIEDEVYAPVTQKEIIKIFGKNFLKYGLAPLTATAACAGLAIGFSKKEAQLEKDFLFYFKKRKEN